MNNYVSFDNEQNYYYDLKKKFSIVYILSVIISFISGSVITQFNHNSCNNTIY